MRSAHVKNLFILTAAAGLALTLMSAGSYAGFQWVPPGQQDSAAAPGATPESSVMTPAPTMPVAAQPLPEPSSSPVTPMPAPETAEALPQQNMHVLTIPAKSARAPAPAAAPAQEQQPQPLIKVLSVAPQPAPAPQEAPQQAAQELAPPPPLSQPKDMPGEITWNPPSAPVTEETKIIMPEDAPVKAVKAAPNGKLVINPFPDKNQAAPQEESPAPIAAMEPAPSQSGFDPVVGFGSDMPLALALQQIAPPSYTFSYGESVNPGARVSWEGKGQSWDQVISSMIEPLNLQAAIKGNVVHIGQPGGAPEKQSAAEPEASEKPVKISSAELRRNAVRDPGEAARIQPVIEIEPASGGPEEEQPAVVTDKLAQEAPPEEIKSLLEEAPEPQEGAANTWQVRQGDSLKEILAAWSKQANVDFVWNASHDYTIEADITVNDSFENAVGMIMKQGIKATPKPLFVFQAKAENGKAGILVVQDQA